MRIFKDNSFRILLVIFVLFLALPLLFTEPSSTPVVKGQSYNEGELQGSSVALPSSQNPFKAMLDNYFDKFSKFYQLPFAKKTAAGQLSPSAILFNTAEDAQAFIAAQNARREGGAGPGGEGGADEGSFAPGPRGQQPMKEVGRVYLDGTDYFPVMSDGKGTYFVYTPQGLVPYNLFTSDYVPQEDIEKARAMAPGLSDDEIALALKTVGLNEYLSAVARDGHESTYNRLSNMLNINPQAFGYGYAAADGRGAFSGPVSAFGGAGGAGGAGGDMAADLGQKYDTASSTFKGVGQVYNPAELAQQGNQNNGEDVFAKFGPTRIAGSENGVIRKKKEGYVFEPKDDSQLKKPRDVSIREELAIALGLIRKKDSFDPNLPVILPSVLKSTFGKSEVGPMMAIYAANFPKSGPDEFSKSDKIYIKTVENIKKELEDLQGIPPVVIIDGNESGNIIAMGKETFYTAVTSGLMGGRSPIVDQTTTPLEVNAGEKKITVDRIDTKKLDSLKQSAIIIVSTKEEKEILEKDGYTYVVVWQDYGTTPQKLDKVYEGVSSSVTKMAEKQRERRKKEQKLIKETKEDLQKGPK